MRANLWSFTWCVVVSAALRAVLHGAPAVRAVWDLGRAYRESTPTRERVCINGLWRWQPAGPTSARPPTGQWGHFKVPGAWPGITNYMQKDCQVVHAHPSWADIDLRGVRAAWYEREITVPSSWRGRRIALKTEYLNSYALVFIDGRRAGEIRFPAGEVDLSGVCRPGQRHRLTMLVIALPLKGVMKSFNNTNAARAIRGAVARRGLCGDVWLAGAPAGPRVEEVRVVPSVRARRLTVKARVENLPPGVKVRLRAQVSEGERTVREFESPAFSRADLEDDWQSYGADWIPSKLWDIHTPRNQHRVTVELRDETGRLLDRAFPVTFGFREFWIQGRDFYLNGSHIFLCGVPLDNAQVGAWWATYQAAFITLTRLKRIGVNFVYTHNYGCEPGAHLSFDEILRAADDVGVLVALSQPHFAHYDWKAADADIANGYAQHAAFYVHVAGSHPSVVMYATSHNATGYAEDMNPDLIDGVHDARTRWSRNNAELARRAEAIIHRLDPSRVTYHHSSGNLGAMHTVNFYPNWVPIQEMSDWFEHWASDGAKPLFTCEYSAPFAWDWAMYRGWYKGARNFGSALAPWGFCLAEWNAQFMGAEAYRISEEEKTNLRWEAKQYRAGKLWHRWDYPHQLGSRDFDERYPIIAAYLRDNWRAFRTWGVSAISPWQYGLYWKMRADLVRNQRIEAKTDWDELQRPGFSHDYIEERYERMDLTYGPSDWLPTPAADALLRNNRPLLAYIGGKPGRFTSKNHIFLPGEVVEKQLILINNSRRTVSAECRWLLDLQRPISGQRSVTVETGEQQRIPLRFPLPDDLRPGAFEIVASVTFSDGEKQDDRFDIQVVSPPGRLETKAKLALFDPLGETTTVLQSLGVQAEKVAADSDVSGYDALVIGKGALSPDGPAPKMDAVRSGLRVLVFEQTADALEKRLGFRVAEYGLRNVFRCVPDHPALAGLDERLLRDWRGAATLTPARLQYYPSQQYNGVPAVRWCGLEVPRLWRCGNRGNVASVLIEKPARGDFLPLLDGGFSLQYSPLLEFRQGGGSVLFCQMDVTGRTEEEPAAMRLARNLVQYVSAPMRSSPERRVVYVGEQAGLRHLRRAGIAAEPLRQEPLDPGALLVAGRGSGNELAARKLELADWLARGGRLLTLGLDAEEANSFLPAPVQSRSSEHIAAYFEPPPSTSPFAGVSPADVHNRAPRDLPLLIDGVLASVGPVVFCQMLPYDFITEPDQRPAFTVDDGDSYEGKRSALVTMATVPWAQFGQRVKAGQRGETYTFSVTVKPLGKPVMARLEVERSASPWDRALRGPDTKLQPDRWTKLRATFRVDREYPQGWSAYLNILQPEARVRVDAFRLGRVGAEDNLFADGGFESSAGDWFFNWRAEQQNLRKTYRRASFLLTRILANLGARGDTPLLERFANPASGRGGASVVRNGDFSRDEDGDGVPDEWQVSSSIKGFACRRVETQPGSGEWRLRLESPPAVGGKPASLMLAQHGVPIEKGQWYRLSFQTRAEGFAGREVTWTVSETSHWHSLFEYQRFRPIEQWRAVNLLVQAKDSGEKTTRFQIWHGHAGVLWLAEIQLVPVPPPAEGRWTSGLYVDAVQTWDDPYRFFRW